MIQNRLFKLLIVASSIVIITACGGGGTTGATGTTTGTVNFKFDGVADTYYTINTTDGITNINSASVTRNDTETSIWVVSYKGIYTSGDSVTFHITFPDNKIQTGTFTQSEYITHSIGQEWYTNTGYTVNVTKVTDDGTSIHVEGSIDEIELSEHTTNEIKTISVDFNIDATEWVIPTT